MDRRLLKEEDVFNCAAPSFFADSEFQLDGDIFDVGGESYSLFADTTWTFLDVFDLPTETESWSEDTVVTTDDSIRERARPECPHSRTTLATRESEAPSQPKPRARKVNQKPVLPPTAKRRVRAIRTEAKPRRRHKTEILNLRSEVTTLQDRLWQLQGGGTCKPHVADASVSTEAAIAAAARQVDTRLQTFELLSSALNTLNQEDMELQKLQHAQALNCCLKAALAEKVQLRRMFEGWLEKQTIFQAHNFELLKGLSMAPTDSQDQSDRLLDKLESLIRDTDRDFSEIEGPFDTRSTSSRTKSDGVHRLTLEEKTNTSIPGSFQFLGEYLWKHITTSASGSTGWTQEQGPKSASAHEKHYSMVLETPFGPVQVDCVTLMHRFAEEDEAHRVVLAYTSEISVAERDYRFKENGWLVLTEDPKMTAASPSSLLQSFYQLFRDKLDPLKSELERLQGSDRAYQQELVMNALLNRARARQLHIETLMRFDPICAGITSSDCT